MDLTPGYIDENQLEDVADSIRIKVENCEKNSFYVWEIDKFHDRYYLFRE